MFVAALGFLIYWYIVFFQLMSLLLVPLDGHGESMAMVVRLLLAYAVFLIPYALWIEIKILHI